MTLRRMSLCFLAVLPSPVKCAFYRRLFKFEIGAGVRIGWSIIDVERCVIGDDVSIGHGNLITSIKRLHVGDHARIGYLNVFRGGDEVSIGKYSEVLRLNEINSIPDPRIVNRADPRFLLGDESSVTAGHKIDFTDRVEIGKRTVLGGRNSSVWTHNRQRTLPVTIGSYCYVGSEIRMAPGATIPSRCVVGMGAVVVKPLDRDNSFIAGVPAKVVRPLGEDDHALLEWCWRPDLPGCQ